MPALSLVPDVLPGVSQPLDEAPGPLSCCVERSLLPSTVSRMSLIRLFLLHPWVAFEICTCNFFFETSVS